MSRAKILGLAEIADTLGIKATSARVYHTRAVANRRARSPRPGDLPPPDLTVGNRPAWYEATILRWLEQRPGKGTGGGRPKR